jgi:invasion protein IalB
MRTLTFSGLAIGAMFAMAISATAQTATVPVAPKPTAAKPGAKPAGPAWISQCSADARTAVLNCAMEQRLAVQSGQLLASMNIQVPGATRAPTLVLQLPLGLSLAAGASLQMDALPPVKIPIKACEQNGCVAFMALPATTIAQMQTAKTMSLVIQNLQNKEVKVPFTMTGFAATYAKIK